jgi:hypothetical protein
MTVRDLWRMDAPHPQPLSREGRGGKEWQRGQTCTATRRLAPQRADMRGNVLLANLLPSPLAGEGLGGEGAGTSEPESRSVNFHDFREN